MAKPGPKTKPNHLKSVAGTDRADRSNVVAFEPPPGDATLPAHFEKLKENKPKFAESVLEIWNSQIAKYRDRGQPTAGYDRALYQMCLLEATILAKYENGLEVPQAMTNGLRVYYSEFHDTPAGNMKSGGHVGKGNEYGKRPPKPTGPAKK
jgi:hypothetical protein